MKTLGSLEETSATNAHILASGQGGHYIETALMALRDEMCHRGSTGLSQCVSGENSLSTPSTDLEKSWTWKPALLAKCPQSQWLAPLLSFELLFHAGVERCFLLACSLPSKCTLLGVQVMGWSSVTWTLFVPVCSELQTYWVQGFPILWLAWKCQGRCKFADCLARGSA